MDREGSAVVSKPVPLDSWVRRPAPYQLVHAAVHTTSSFHFIFLIILHHLIMVLIQLFRHCNKSLKGPSK